MNGMYTYMQSKMERNKRENYAATAAASTRFVYFSYQQ